MNKFFEKVYEYVQTVPRGKVVTYGQVARAIGYPHMSRQVGYALHANPREGEIPCHRVVDRFGGLKDAFAFGGKDEHRRRLQVDGVEVRSDYTVDLSVYRYMD